MWASEQVGLKRHPLEPRPPTGADCRWAECRLRPRAEKALWPWGLEADRAPMSVPGTSPVPGPWQPAVFNLVSSNFACWGPRVGDPSLSVRHHQGGWGGR